MRKLAAAGWELLQITFWAWLRDRASRWAAAVAYYTLFSLAPLVLLSISLASLVESTEAAQRQLVRQVGDLAGVTAAQAVEFIISNGSRMPDGRLATVISLVALLWGASAVFFAVQDGLNVIWNVPPRRNWAYWRIIRKRLASFSIMVMLGLLLIASALLNAILSSFNRFLSEFGPPPARGLQILDLLITFVLITLLFAAIYKILPDVDIAWGDVWVGALLTALLFAVGRYVIGFYLRLVGVSSAYGAASTFIALLVWVYYSAQIFFFGAELTQAYANRYGSRLTPLAFVPPEALPGGGEATDKAERTARET